MRILLIDDEDTLRRGIARLLQQLDMDIKIVGEAEDGVEGLERLRLHKPDVAFVDIRMPLMDGLQLVQIAREQQVSPHTKLVMVTAHSEFDYAQKALRYGASDFLLKPLNVAILNDLFARLGFRTEASMAAAAAPVTVSAELGPRQMEAYLREHPPGHELIEHVLRYIGSNYMLDLQLSELAEQFRVTPAYLSSLFKKATGTAFVSFLQQFRIDLAKLIMVSNDYKLGEIAYMVGFNDLTYFGRIFKARTGMTPNDYLRKRHS